MSRFLERVGDLSGVEQVVNQTFGSIKAPERLNKVIKSVQEGFPDFMDYPLVDHLSYKKDLIFDSIMRNSEIVNLLGISPEEIRVFIQDLVIPVRNILQYKLILTADIYDVVLSSSIIELLLTLPTQKRMMLINAIQKVNLNLIQPEGNIGQGGMVETLKNLVTGTAKSIDTIVLEKKLTIFTDILLDTARILEVIMNDLSQIQNVFQFEDLNMDSGLRVYKAIDDVVLSSFAVNGSVVLQPWEIVSSFLSRITESTSETFLNALNTLRVSLTDGALSKEFLITLSILASEAQNTKFQLLDAPIIKNLAEAFPIEFNSMYDTDLISQMQSIFTEMNVTLFDKLERLRTSYMNYMEVMNVSLISFADFITIIADVNTLGSSDSFYTACEELKSDLIECSYGEYETSSGKDCGTVTYLANSQNSDRRSKCFNMLNRSMFDRLFMNGGVKQEDRYVESLANQRYYDGLRFYMPPFRRFQP